MLFQFIQMWYEWAVVWRRGAEEHSSAHECAVLKQACAALPDCVMLSFALADALEATGKHAEALKVFEVCCTLFRQPNWHTAQSQKHFPHGEDVYVAHMHTFVKSIYCHERIMAARNVTLLVNCA